MKLQSNANGDIINNGQQTVTGDDINGSTNPELLGGRTVSTANRGGNGVRQQGENSRKISSFVEGASNVEGVGNSTLRAGDSGWFVRQAEQKGEIRNRFEESVRGKISRIAPSGFDTIGRKISLVMWRFWKRLDTFIKGLTPEGKTFELLKTEDTKSTITGHSQKTMAEPYIDSVSKNSISKPKEKINKKFSDASPYFVEKMNKLSEDFKRGFGENKKIRVLNPVKVTY